MQKVIEKYGQKTPKNMMNKTVSPLVYELVTKEGDFEKNTDPTDTSIVAFTNSATLLFAGQKNRVIISNDNGLHWETVLKFETPKVNDPSNFLNKYIQLDAVYTDKRAFFFPQNETHNLRACCTNDIGRTWVTFNLQFAVEKHFYDFSVSKTPSQRASFVRLVRIRSSPINNKHLLASVSLNNDDKCNTFNIDFLSLDFGQSWVPVMPIKSIAFEKHIYSIKCFFGQKSDELFCLLLKEEPLSCQDKTNNEESPEDQKCTESGKLYYSTDLGNTWSLQEDLKNESVVDIDIKGNFVVAYVPEKNIDVWTCTHIYISNDFGKSFRKPKYMGLSNDVSQNQNPYITGADFTNDVMVLNTSKGKTWIGDYTSLQFFLPKECGTQKDEIFLVHNLCNQPHTLLLITHRVQARIASQGNFMQSFNIEDTKISFDDGKSWTAINLNPLHDSKKNGFKENFCDIDSYKFKATGVPALSSFAHEPLDIFTLAGYLVRKDPKVNGFPSVGCTIVTQNGGRTFDFSLDVPLHVSIGNSGNIFLGFNSTRNGSNNKEAKNKLYYSLNQGHSWDCLLLAGNVEVVDVFALEEDGSGFQFLVCTYTTSSSEDASYKKYFVVDFSTVG